MLTTGLMVVWTAFYWSSFHVFRIVPKMIESGVSFKLFWRGFVRNIDCTDAIRGYQRGLASLCCVTVQCGRATHGLRTVWELVLHRGCPCQDPPVCPPMPKQDGIGVKAPTLCCACACVASWHAHSTIWNCGVVKKRSDGDEMSAPPLEWAECSAQSSRHVPPCDRRCRNPSC